MKTFKQNLRECADSMIPVIGGVVIGCCIVAYVLAGAALTIWLGLNSAVGFVLTAASLMAICVTTCAAWKTWVAVRAAEDDGDGNS